MKKLEIKDAGAEYAEIWGEAIHTNRHLRMISGGLAIAVLLLIVVVFRIVSVEPPRPIVVRVDEVGRAEAVSYEAMEAQADPLDPTTKYFLNRFIYDFYSPWREIGPYLRELWHRPAGPMNWKNPIRVFAVVGWLVCARFRAVGVGRVSRVSRFPFVSVGRVSRRAIRRRASAACYSFSSPLWGRPDGALYTVPSRRLTSIRSSFWWN